jgi:oxygen-independent coproporphyrinogen-3 oxidase
MDSNDSLAANPQARRVRWLWPRAAYIHIPFCAHHCGYCDFAVVSGRDGLIDLYLDALASELATLGQPQPVETIFIGGGTPTYLDCPRLQRILGEVRRWLPFVPNVEPPEFTVEANPGSLDSDKVAVLAGHGVSRISLGAQSFRPRLLQTLERDHQPKDVARAIEIVKRRVPQVSLDLIFGIPGQTLADWQQDLQQALALEPDHLSTYGLTYEQGTRLWQQRQRGEIRPLDEETELAMYLHALDALEAAGLEHYEISNHALPGRRSRHNQVYWANEAYFGFGLGAARYIEGRRELNTRSLDQYIRRALAGEPTAFQSEVLSPEERAKETMALQLRRAEGIHRDQFREQTGFALDELAGSALTRNVDRGFMIDNQVSVRLTRQGKCLADAIIRDLL